MTKFLSGKKKKKSVTRKVVTSIGCVRTIEGTHPISHTYFSQYADVLWVRLDTF